MMKYDEDVLDRISAFLENEVGESYLFSQSELSEQRTQAWSQYYREDDEADLETEGYSSYKSGMVQRQVNQISAYISNAYARSNRPIAKFKSDDATAYVNHIFRNEMDGEDIIDQCIFNAALLKNCSTRTHLTNTTKKEYGEEIIPGRSKEEVNANLDIWQTANPDTVVIDKEYVTEDITDPETGEPHEIHVCKFTHSISYTEKKVASEVIAPEQLYVSYNAESRDKADMVARISVKAVDYLKDNFPDAPELNGIDIKNEGEVQGWWDSLTGDYASWTQELEWYARWENDASSYFENYVGQDADAGMDARTFMIMDAEIYFIADDEGDKIKELFHVIKVGGAVLFIEPITHRGIDIGYIKRIPNKWIGQSIPDMIRNEEASVDTSMRAMDDAVVMSQHSNPIVDEEQIELEDVINRQPDSIIRRKRNSIAKAGIAAIEWTKQPGVDGQAFALVNTFQEFASASTGVGKFFQGHQQDDLSDVNISEGTAKIIENNSNLMLDYWSRNFSRFVKHLQCTILRVATTGADPVEIPGYGMVDPTTLDPEDTPVLNVIIGFSEEQELQQKSVNALTITQQVMANPATAATISPMATYRIMKDLFLSSGYEEKDLPELIINPMEAQQITQDPQVAGIVQKLVEQGVQEQMQQPQMQNLQLQNTKLQVEIQEKMQGAQAEMRKLDINEAKLVISTKNAVADEEYKAAKTAIELRRIDLTETIEAAKLALDQWKAHHEILIEKEQKRGATI